MITADKKNICIIAFNIGISKAIVNGPGMSLLNFISFISKDNKLNIKIYCQLPTLSKIDNIEIKNISDLSIKDSIKNSDIVHIRSGLTQQILSVILLANKFSKPIVFGPNLLDTVNEELEKKFINCAGSNLKKILSVNDRLRYLFSSRYNMQIKNIETLIVGPDTSIWSPPDFYEDYILWKGNSSHFVKDIQFGKDVASKLNKYKFIFLGDSSPYDYQQHINIAKKAKIYFSTSLSETKGMALMEQWACGVPSVTHPKIYMHGENYKTGIITNRDINSYCDAIEEIMSNPILHNNLSSGAVKWVKENFNEKILCSQYEEILNNVC